MMPCNPPIAFWSTVGQAIFQTAWAIGPSTIERSNWRAGRLTGGIAGEAGAGSAAGGAVTDRSPDKKKNHSIRRVTGRITAWS